MDLTDKYIQMCQKATEIQALWEYLQGDWYVDKYFPSCGAGVLELDVKDDDSGDHFYSRESQIEEFRRDESVWLPRQDQLQGIICLHWWKDEPPVNAVSVMLQVFGWWLDDRTPSFESMEQLLFAFMMSELFDKVWNGTDWIKEE
ncbi:MAG: hypothetical protein M0R49_01085 [Limnochordia bacterium]|nr:hypothetical protein [Limnochordia bacterium]